MVWAVSPLKLLETNQTMDQVSFQDRANALRALTMDAVEAAGSGHPGMPMGMADVATVLFEGFLNFDPTAPDWVDRDRFILSAGHGSMLLYALLYLTGYADVDIDQLRQFRQLGSRTPGHPENFVTRGIDTTTGPLGQGLATAVGMAMAERHLNARFGDALVNHRTFVIASDGDLMEGISHEAATLAGHLGLSRLIVLWDDNGISIDGSTDLAMGDDVPARFSAAGWATSRVDGHDPQAVSRALSGALCADRPSLIACRTRIGFGAPTKEGTSGSHGAPLGPEEVAGARSRLGWPHPAFTIPLPVADHWRETGRRGNARRLAWEERRQASPDPIRQAFDEAMAGAMPATAKAALDAATAVYLRDRPKLATRVASGKVLEALVPAWPELIGGSADLTGSNLTFASGTPKLTRDVPAGRYVHWGVREHAMAAAMNGLSLHGGIVPYGGTFLVFSDYCRPAIRLAALMGRRVVYVLTHDSIGLGEDGPTHQPVEHLASLRAIPNLLVFRPADAVETARCWHLALLQENRPSVLALSRQALPTLFPTDLRPDVIDHGAYILAGDGERRQATLIATGSEVEIAMAARSLLARDGIEAVVVSAPCLELFSETSAAMQQQVLGPDDPGRNVRIAVEAGIRQGWDALTGNRGGFVGMTGFGASAPYQQLYEHFGITAEAVAAAVHARRTQ